MKNYFILLFISLLSVCVKAQTFKKVIHNVTRQYYEVVSTHNDELAIISTTQSFGAGAEDIFFNLNDTMGNLLMTKTYGGNATDLGYSIQSTNDNGFILGGVTTSFGSGSSDFYMIKTDAFGDTIWTKTYGGIYQEECKKALQTKDNGFVAVGNTLSYGAGGYDCYVVKTDPQGSVEWTRTIGGSYSDYANDAVYTVAGELILVGETNSFTSAGSSMYAIKISGLGDTIWTKIFDYNYLDRAMSICETYDKGYAILGTSLETTSGIIYSVVLKLDANGNLVWSYFYEYNQLNEPSKITEAPDSSLTISGTTTINSSNQRNTFLARIDSIGNPIWSTMYDYNSAFEEAFSHTLINQNIYVVGRYQPAIPTPWRLLLLKADQNGNHTTCGHTTISANRTLRIPTISSGGSLGSGGNGKNTSTLVSNPSPTNSYLCNTFTEINANDVSMSLYPNPSKGILTIGSILLKGSNPKIKVFNMHGQELFYQVINHNSQQVDVSHLNRGFYWVRVYTDQKSESTLLLIE